MSKGNSPAFPCQDNKKQIYTGMNLRDYFALEAMNAQFKRIPWDKQWSPQELSIQAYQVADAMLEERAKYP